MIGVTEEIQQSSRLLRDLAARSHSPRARSPLIANHLNVVLTCLSKTLRDITVHYEDKTISRENRWKKMYQDMQQEADGLTLPQRFILYNHFLNLVRYLLTRDRRLDPAALAQLRAKILDLRRKRDIPDPGQQTLALEPAAATARGVTPPASADQLVPCPPGGAVALPGPGVAVNWCERVFARPPAAQTDTGLDERVEINVPMSPALVAVRPRGRVVMRRSYDDNRFCAKFVLVGSDEEPFVVLRMYKDGGSFVAWRAHNDLVASREGNAVVLRRWSQRQAAWSAWARFAFVHWEGERAKSFFFCARGPKLAFGR